MIFFPFCYDKFIHCRKCYGTGLLYILGAMFYALRVPERWFPGKFDLWVSYLTMKLHFFLVTILWNNFCIRFFFVVPIASNIPRSCHSSGFRSLSRYQWNGNVSCYGWWMRCSTSRYCLIKLFGFQSKPQKKIFPNSSTEMRWKKKFNWRRKRVFFLKLISFLILLIQLTINFEKYLLYKNE